MNGILHNGPNVKKELVYSLSLTERNVVGKANSLSLTKRRYLGKRTLGIYVLSGERLSASNLYVTAANAKRAHRLTDSFAARGLVDIEGVLVRKVTVDGIENYINRLLGSYHR